MELAVIVKYLPYLLAVNVVLASVAKALEIVGKKVPVLETVCAFLQKVVDFVSANPKH